MATKTIWCRTKYTGVRYREHATRKLRNGQPDKYFTIRYRVDGKRIEEPLGWASDDWTAEKAHEALAAVRRAITMGTDVASLRDMRKAAQERREAKRQAAAREEALLMPLRVFFERHYMPVAKLEKRSWRTEEQRIIKEINPLLGDIPLQSLTPTHVQELVNKLEGRGAAPATIRQYVSIIRRGWTIALKTKIEGMALVDGPNPASEKELRLPKIHNARERYLSAKEAKALLHAAGKDWMATGNSDLHDAIELSLNTGLRLGELARLDWMDVDLVGGIVSVREEDKRKPGGKVPLNKTAQTIFIRRKKTDTPGPVFPGTAGPEAWQQYISKSFKALVDALKFNEGIATDDRRRRVVFHTLRHTFASWMAINGTDIYRIMALMRHRSISMTMRYAHLIPDTTKNAVHNLKPPKDS